MIHRLLAYSALLLGLAACAKTYQAPDFPDTQLQFGSGGGFTGGVKTYHLLPNGQLFSHASLEDRYREVGRLDKKKAKELFQKAVALDWTSATSKEPGNINYFLQFQNESAAQQRIQWNAAPEEGDEFGQLYQSLMREVRQLSAR